MKNLKSAILMAAFIATLLPLTISAQTSDTKTNVAIMQSSYENFAKGDIPALFAILDPKVEWNEAENFIYGDGKPFVGHDALLNGLFAKIGEEWEYWKIVNPQFHNMDNGMVLVTGRYNGKYKKNGAIVDAQVAHLWTLKDGKVIRFQQYTDTRQIADAIKK